MTNNNQESSGKRMPRWIPAVSLAVIFLVAAIILLLWAYNSKNSSDSDQNSYSTTWEYCEKWKSRRIEGSDDQLSWQPGYYYSIRTKKCHYASDDLENGNPHFRSLEDCNQTCENYEAKSYNQSVHCEPWSAGLCEGLIGYGYYYDGEQCRKGGGGSGCGAPSFRSQEECEDFCLGYQQTDYPNAPNPIPESDLLNVSEDIGY